MKFLVRDRIFGIGDDYWIEDEQGQRVFLVDGKALRLRETFELKDADGQVLVTIKKKWLSLRDTMEIERDGDVLATVRKKRLSVLRDHYRVQMADGTELDVSGDVLDKEYGVEYGDELLAHVSRKWFTVRETYAVNVVREDADAPLLIAVAVCVDRLSDRAQGDDE
ncbi:LURP-one-related/scramblase family protein [Streptomyces meridianus]|uniref:LURP-one-related family protein n=1 Tax=Streptomyces meridianus TaxID=2938945 RepID=A0ABT0X6Q8_9ACTN|nr:LURP-one-related family protein [Streptomyces meridianus]MCM2578025.1 LURP-one-related family protein [Streptomyces meridianus]